MLPSTRRRPGAKAARSRPARRAAPEVGPRALAVAPRSPPIRYHTFPGRMPCLPAHLHGVDGSMTRSLRALALSFALTAFAARADDEHQTVHVGAMLGLVSLPRPLDVGVFVRFVDLMSVGFSFTVFPNFFADPLLTAIGAKEGGTIARLDDFSAYEADLRLYPFRGAFFFGASLGHQSLKGAVIETTTGTSQTGTANVQTIYVTRRG